MSRTVLLHAICLMSLHMCCMLCYQHEQQQPLRGSSSSAILNLPDSVDPELGEPGEQLRSA